MVDESGRAGAGRAGPGRRPFRVLAAVAALLLVLAVVRVVNADPFPGTNLYVADEPPLTYCFHRDFGDDADQLAVVHDAMSILADTTQMTVLHHCTNLRTPNNELGGSSRFRSG